MTFIQFEEPTWMAMKNGPPSVGHVLLFFSGHGHGAWRLRPQKNDRSEFRWNVLRGSGYLVTDYM